MIRGKGGHKYNPSAREFTAALRGLSVANILPALSASTASNCELDDGTTLLASMSEDAIPSTSTAPMTSMALPTTLTTEMEDEEPVVSDIVEDQVNSTRQNTALTHRYSHKSHGRHSHMIMLIFNVTLYILLLVDCWRLHPGGGPVLRCWLACPGPSKGGNCSGLSTL